MSSVEDLVAIIISDALAEVALRSPQEIAGVGTQHVEVVLVEVKLAVNNLRHFICQDPQRRCFVQLRKRKLEKNEARWCSTYNNVNGIVEGLLVLSDFVH